jgi:methylmalonyl-CoA/ethylmalonyl-CoA epimerase
MELHHVGVATPDAAGLVAAFGDLLSAEVTHEERFDGMDVVFLDGGGTALELLEPVAGEGPVARFLNRRGAGVHHLAFAVADVAAALDEARAAGASVATDEPRAGAWGHDVAFLHPDATGGVLVELVEAG